MKIDARFPGGEIHIEKEPLDKERFESLIGLVSGIALGAGVLLFFAMVFGLFR